MKIILTVLSLVFLCGVASADPADVFGQTKQLVELEQQTALMSADADSQAAQLSQLEQQTALMEAAGGEPEAPEVRALLSSQCSGTPTLTFLNGGFQLRAEGNTISSDVARHITALPTDQDAKDLLLTLFIGANKLDMTLATFPVDASGNRDCDAANIILINR